VTPYGDEIYYTVVERSTFLFLTFKTLYYYTEHLFYVVWNQGT